MKRKNDSIEDLVFEFSKRFRKSPKTKTSKDNDKLRRLVFAFERTEFEKRILYERINQIANSNLKKK